jgi:hypothetical protein
MIASLSIPWGDEKSDEELGGYHLVWTRDMVKCVSSLLAVGDFGTPLRALIYLAVSQREDGGFYQNFWIDGRPHWLGIQLDEVAFPILLAWRLWKLGALGNFDPFAMVGARAGFLSKVRWHFAGQVEKATAILHQRWRRALRRSLRGGFFTGRAADARPTSGRRVSSVPCRTLDGYDPGDASSWVTRRHITLTRPTSFPMREDRTTEQSFWRISARVALNFPLSNRGCRLFLELVRYGIRSAIPDRGLCARRRRCAPSGNTFWSLLAPLQPRWLWPT